MVIPILPECMLKQKKYKGTNTTDIKWNKRKWAMSSSFDAAFVFNSVPHWFSDLDGTSCNSIKRSLQIWKKSLMKIFFRRLYSPKLHPLPPPPHRNKRRKTNTAEFRAQYEVTNEQRCSKYIPQSCKNCITHNLIPFNFSLKLSPSLWPGITSGHFLW